MKVSEFNKIKKYSEGSGVIAAVEPNIKMNFNEYGTYEEIVNTDSDIELNAAVERVSPNFNTERNETLISEELFSNIENIQFDERLGFYKSLYVGHVKEGTFRDDATSGGLGTWIFHELFTKGLIDKVIHVKKINSVDDSRLFKYYVSDTLEGIREGAKTRYYPVELSEVIQIVKDNPGNYAIIGIPSFIMAIRLLAEEDEIIKQRIKYTVGIICGHQKSSKFTDSLALQLGIQPEDIVNIDYRKKVKGSPANRYAVEIESRKNGKTEKKEQFFKDFIEENWGQGLFKERASDFTDDVFNETADITLGDAWLPEYTKDPKGNNVVIVRNEMIEKLIKEAVKEKRLVMDVVDAETIFSSQSSHYKHTHDELAYRLYKLKEKNLWYPKKRVKPSNNIDPLRRKVQDLREELSISSHIIFEKSVEENNYEYYFNSMEKLIKKYLKQYKINRVKQLGIRGSYKKIIERILNK